MFVIGFKPVGFCLWKFLSGSHFLVDYIFYISSEMIGLLKLINNLSSLAMKITAVKEVWISGLN